MTTEESQDFDVLIVGAGAAGLMCALVAGGRGIRVLLLDHNRRAGAKILISGGGRCNFTNEDTAASAYSSQNPHFAKSALTRYSHWDFLDLMSRHGLTWNEKKLGQLFCDQGSKAILTMLETECDRAGVKTVTGCKVRCVIGTEAGYSLQTSAGDFRVPRLVVATGGLSIPKMGATGFAYDVARQFGLGVVAPTPALVPLVFSPDDLAFMRPLAGVSLDCLVSLGRVSFRENLLFTHRGLSGPAILQISSYWTPGDVLSVNLVPAVGDCREWLAAGRADSPRLRLNAFLATVLPGRFVDSFLNRYFPDEEAATMGQLSNRKLAALASTLHAWEVKPTGDEGFAKAEVTKGGVDTADLSSRTMEAKNQPGLYFIGECVDVTGWLGGYNFQWAWASAAAAATAF